MRDRLDFASRTSATVVTGAGRGWTLNWNSEKLNIARKCKNRIQIFVRKGGGE